MDGALVLLLPIGIVVVVVVVIFANASSRRAAEEQRRREQAEHQRLEDCGRVVLEFANHLGYIARQVISRQELDALIDTGISSDQLGAEIARRIDEADGLVLGYHAFGSTRIPVKVTQEFRDRHLYIVGKSGSGKTNLIRNLVLQDLYAGNGLAVIAPEQEMLTEEILPYIPEERLDDVIYFNPADTACPVSFNPLHLDDGEDVDIKVDENLTIFKRVLGDTGPRMEEILRQSLYTLVERPGSTLLDIPRLLDRADDSFRKEVIHGCASPEQAAFWRDVYPRFPADAHLPITNRLGRFLHAKTIRHTLCSPAGRSLNFGKCMDAGKVMLFNLSDGVLGEQNSQLLGQLIVSKFQLAVMSRAKLSKFRRRQFYLYIDEFQTFTGTAGASYEKILSRARKYKLGLTIAHQQTGQIGGDLLKEILGNVSTAICFLVSREDAIRFSREFVTPFNGEVLNVPEQEILKLRVGQAWCKMGQHAFLMHTYLADQRPDYRWAQIVIDRARHNYGTPLEAQAAAMLGSAPAGRIAAPSAAEALLDDLDPSAIF